MAKPQVKEAKSVSTSSATIILICIASVAVVCSLLISNGLWKSLSFSTKLLGEKQATNRTLQRNVEAVPNLTVAFNELQTLGPNETRILHALPTEFDFGEIGTNIEQLALVSGVTLTNLENDFSDGGEQIEVDGGVVGVVPVSVSFSGSYEDVIATLENFEKSLLPYKIESVSIEASELSVSANVELSTYYQAAKTIEFEKRTIQ